MQSIKSLIEYGRLMKNLIFSIYKPVDVDRKFTAKQTNTIKQFEKYLKHAKNALKTRTNANKS